MPLIPVSIGEVVDKLTILRIKLKYIQDPVKVKVVSKQYTDILNCLQDLDKTDSVHQIKESELDTDQDFLELHDINQKLWNMENFIRQLVKKDNYGSVFCDVSKDIRLWNDTRAKVKERIDKRYKSEFWDVKEHN